MGARTYETMAVNSALDAAMAIAREAYDLMLRRENIRRVRDIDPEVLAQLESNWAECLLTLGDVARRVGYNLFPSYINGPYVAVYDCGGEWCGSWDHDGGHRIC